MYTDVLIGSGVCTCQGAEYVQALFTYNRNECNTSGTTVKLRLIFRVKLYLFTPRRKFYKELEYLNTPRNHSADNDRKQPSFCTHSVPARSFMTHHSHAIT